MKQIHVDVTNIRRNVVEGKANERCKDMWAQLFFRLDVLFNLTFNFIIVGLFLGYIAPPDVKTRTVFNDVHEF